MSRPKLLDLYSGAGGCARGYQLAGFHVTGVDVAFQPRYAGDVFIQADALEYVAAHGHEYDCIAASPPCQRYSISTHARRRGDHPDLLPATRAALETSGKPWVIENVPGAPMRADYVLCGCMFGLPHLRRQRWFETSWRGCHLRPACHHPDYTISVAGHGTPTGNRNVLRRNVAVSEWREAMGIDWMTRAELAQAIPPAYTAWLGERLRHALGLDPLEQEVSA